MNTSYTHDLERLVVAQVIFTLPFAPLETAYFVFTILCLQICSHFEKVSSAAVDTLAEILSR